MASVLQKNASLLSGYRTYLSSNGLQFIRPVQDVDAISTGVTGGNLAVGQRLLMVQAGGAACEIGAYQGTIFYCAYPFAPDFTLGTAADTFSYEINGWDHFGNPIQEVGSKTNGATQMRCFRVFSAISSVFVTGITGTGTLTLGFSYAVTTGASQRKWPLPFALDRSTLVVGCQTLSVGGQTAPSSPDQRGGQTLVTTGGKGTATEDTVLAQNNAAQWTPRKLAQVGVAVTTEGVWTAGAQYTQPPTMRWVLTPEALFGQ